MKNNLAYLLYEIVVQLRIIQLAYETAGLFGIQVGCKICIALAILIIM